MVMSSATENENPQQLGRGYYIKALLIAYFTMMTGTLAAAETAEA